MNRRGEWMKKEGTVGEGIEIDRVMDIPEL